MTRKMREGNYERTSKVIQSDKSVMSEGCKALVLQDFARMFGEYFELDGLPEIDIARERGEYKVTVTFTADRVKQFNVLK